MGSSSLGERIELVVVDYLQAMLLAAVVELPLALVCAAIAWSAPRWCGCLAEK